MPDKTLIFAPKAFVARVTNAAPFLASRVAAVATESADAGYDGTDVVQIQVVFGRW